MISVMFSLLPAVFKSKALGNFVTDFLGLLLLIRSVLTRAFNTGNIYLNTWEKGILYGIEIDAHSQSDPKFLSLLGQQSHSKGWAIPLCSLELSH